MNPVDVPFACFDTVKLLCHVGAILQVVGETYHADAYFEPLRGADRNMIGGVKWEFVTHLGDAGDAMVVTAKLAFARPGSIYLTINRSNQKRQLQFNHTIDASDIDAARKAIEEKLAKAEGSLQP